MSSAFQRNAFQNNAFQSGINPGFASLIGRQVGGMGAPMPLGTPGVLSVWGRWLGRVGVKTAKHKTVGWPDTLRRKVPRKLLERLLQMQKDKQFGRRWFEEFEAAQREFVAADAKAAADIAAREARETAEFVHSRDREDEFSEAMREIALSLEASQQVKRTVDAVAAAQHAQAVARWAKEYIEREEDEDDAIMLLLQ